MLHTATGLVFAAWLPPKVSEHYIAREEGCLLYTSRCV